MFPSVFFSFIGEFFLGKYPDNEFVDNEFVDKECDNKYWFTYNKYSRNFFNSD